MFSHYYKLAITAIFIFLDIVDIYSYQGSKYLDNSYHDKLQTLRRYRRQTAFTLCGIPPYPLHTNYSVFDQFQSRYKSGDYAPNLATLKIVCDKGFNIKPFAQNHSVCIGGIWTPEPSYCERSCPSLKSTISTNVNCLYDNIPLENCYNPVEATIVLVSCNPLYENPTIDIDPTHLCLDGQWEPYIPQCKPICGEKRPLGRVNIINGTDAIRGNYPWHVGIYNTSNHGYLCGGAIITSNIILSAAHCFTDSNGYAFSPERYLVAGGKYHRIYDHKSDGYAQYSKIYKINIPERYRGSTTSQALDIAVCVLKDPFSISRAVQPVCIELNEYLRQLHLSSTSIGIVTGWGYTKEGREQADVLKEVEIPYIPFNKSFDEIPKDFKNYFTVDKICGGYKNSGTSVCTGDSGGALVFKNMITDRFYIKGLVSTSPATIAHQCDSNQYSLYTSIVHHVPFIRDIVTHNQLHYSVECKYNKCANVNEELIRNLQKVEEIVKHVRKELYCELPNNRETNDDDLCVPLIKCSCLFVMFLSSSETTRDPPEVIREIVQKVIPNADVKNKFKHEISTKTCKPGDTCYSLRATIFKLPQEYKQYIGNIKKLILEDGADNRIRIEILIDYDQCSITSLLNKSTNRITEIFKTAVEMGEEINIEY